MNEMNYVVCDKDNFVYAQFVYKDDAEEYIKNDKELFIKKMSEENKTIDEIVKDVYFGEYSQAQIKQEILDYRKEQLNEVLDEIKKWIKITHNSNWRKKSLLMKKIEEIKNRGEK
jgi:hypothetical protein